MKLELRHSRIGNTAWNIVRNCDNAELAGVKFSIVTFGNIFKALIRETVLNSQKCSINYANKVAEREYERLKVHTLNKKEEIVKYIMIFIDQYINNEQFRVQVHKEIAYTYRNGIVTDYVCDLLKDNYDNFNVDECNKELSKITLPVGYDKDRGYIVVLMRSMFLYLYRSKQTSYMRQPFKNGKINKIMRDLYIFRSKGYYWQTTGERVDGINSKLKVPDVKCIEPKVVYDIGDEQYGVLMGAEPESIENMQILLNIKVIQDISYDAYMELLNDIIYDENNISIRLDYDIGILELISDYIFSNIEGTWNFQC